MKLLLLLLVVLTDRAASVADLSGKMFTFPVQNNRAHVKLMTTREDLTTLTVCHRSLTDLKRDHALFSLATPSIPNGFLIFWSENNKLMKPHILDQVVELGGLDYKLNMWHSICTTWDPTTGLVQLWFNGKPSIRKYMSTASNLRGLLKIVIGQEQDGYGGGFDSKQSFTGMMSDIHVWDYILSSCEIQNYVNEVTFTPGNVLNWKAIEYEIVDKVLLEDKNIQCP